jgi:thiol-disulfide isomerase/thioredoxin
MRPTIGLTQLVLALMLLASGCRKLDLFHRAESPRVLAGNPLVGKPAPEIAGETFDGKTMTLSEHRGKVVVLVFWFSGCGPCKAMVPHERELVERHRGKPFVLLGVNNDERAEDAQQVIAAKKMTWPIWKTSGFFDDINKQWGVSLWPAVFVIDANGIVRFARNSSQDLDTTIESLLAECEAKKKN